FGVRFTDIRPNAQALVEHLVARGGTGEPRPRKRRARAALGALLLMMAGAAVWQPPPARQELPPPVAMPAAALPVESVAATLTAQAWPGEFRFELPTGGVTALRVTVDDH